MRGASPPLPHKSFTIIYVNSVRVRLVVAKIINVKVSHLYKIEKK
jgi:hypothetical protein